MITTQYRKDQWKRVGALALNAEALGLPWNIAGEPKGSGHAQIWKDNEGSDDILVETESGNFADAFESCFKQARERGWFP